MQKNIDYVNYDLKVDTSIGFNIIGKAMNASEEFDELLVITKKMFEIIRGFYMPTEIRYSLDVYSEDVSVYSLVNIKQGKSNVKPLEEIIRVVQTDNGISWENLIKDIQKNDAGIKVKTIGVFGFNKGKTRFILKDKDVYIDRNSNDLYGIWKNGVFLDIPNKSDPINMSITQSTFKCRGSKRVESSDPAHYEIAFDDIYTDMWFLDMWSSEIGIANQNMFKKVLKEIYDSFNVDYTFFYSDIYSGDWLKDIIPDIMT